MINILQIAAASLCLSQRLEVSGVPGGDLCSAWKSKWRDCDCRPLHFFPNLLFGNIWLIKFQCLSEDVEHRWTCCHKMRKLQLVFLRSFQAPGEAPLQMSSPKQDPSDPGQWPDSLAELHVSLPLALWAMSHPHGSFWFPVLSKSPGMSLPPLLTPTVLPARMNISPLVFLTPFFLLCMVSPSFLCLTTQRFRCFHGPQQLLLVYPKRNPSHASVQQPSWPAHPG